MLTGEPIPVLVSGSRTIRDYHLVAGIIELSGFNIGLLVHGAEPNGVDAQADLWAQKNDIPRDPHPARWDDLHVPGAVIKTNRYGKPYNAAAGPQRNRHMLTIVKAVIVVWDGKSPGTKGVMDASIERGLALFGIDVATDGVIVYNHTLKGLYG